jgi:hypothetical protein
MGLNEIRREDVEFIYLAKKNFQLWAPVNTALDLRVPLKTRNSRLVERLSASQEGLCFMEVVRSKGCILLKQKYTHAFPLINLVLFRAKQRISVDIISMNKIHACASSLVESKCTKGN